MKAIGINGSPRKEWNTATLLGNVLKGAGAQEARTGLLQKRVPIRFLRKPQ